MATAGEVAGTDGRLPDALSQIPGRSWWGVVKRTVREFQEDGLTDWAAALTYYGVLAVFPALVVVVSLLGLLGDSATQALIDNLGAVAPGAARDVFTTAIEELQKSQRTAGLLAVVALLAALWSASSYVAAFIRACNAIYDIREGRPFWKTTPLRVALTVLLVTLLAISAVAVVFTGGLARQAGKLLGVGSTAVTVFDIVKWPALVLVVTFMIALLYWAAPNVRQPGFRWITPGGVLAVLLWLVVSGVFAVYVANFGSYNKTYGTLAGVIIFLVWLWLSNIAILIGAEFNAELERARHIEGGMPPDEEPYAEPRDTRKMERKGT